MGRDLPAGSVLGSSVANAQDSTAHTLRHVGPWAGSDLNHLGWDQDSVLWPAFAQKTTHSNTGPGFSTLTLGTFWTKLFLVWGRETVMCTAG